MKKLLTLTTLFLFANAFLNAQNRDTITVGKGQFAISGNTYSFFQTIENSQTWNRSVYIYPKEVLRGASRGGKVLAGFQLYRDVSRVTPGTEGVFTDAAVCTATISFGNTDLPDWATVLTWDSVFRAVNMNRVFEGDVKPFFGRRTGWRTFPLTTPFTYDTTKNMAIAVEYQQSVGTSGEMFWSYDSTSVKLVDTSTTNYFTRLQFRFCHRPFSGTAQPVNGFTGSNIRHPQIKFLFRNPNDLQVPVVENILSESIQIFPNPASEVLNLELVAREAGKISAKIVDLSGRVLTQKNVEVLRGDNQTQLIINTLPSGQYFLLIEEGDVVTSKAFYKN